MIEILKLTGADIGAWVEYRGSAGEREKGRIKSWNEKAIFVVYKCGGDWLNFKNYTAAATKPEDLFFLKRSCP